MVERPTVTFRAGFVTLLGLPNVGKSSLFNTILSAKVSIVTDKPQTTRRVSRGILNRENAQVVFLDTPGLHFPRDLLGEAIARSTFSSLEGTDLVLLVVSPDVGAERLLPGLHTEKLKDIPVYLVLNKSDLLTEKQIEQYLDRYTEHFPFQKFFAVSALRGEGIDILLNAVVECMPESPPLYDPVYITDVPEREIAGEIVREKLWEHVFREVPYGIEVQVEEFREKTEKTYIRVIIFVEREAHKKIVIGKKGALLKRVGAEARREIEAFLEKEVFLDLWVKVEKKWRKKKEVLRRFGYYTR